MLMYMNGKAAGHCEKHDTEMSSETKDHAVKPKASAPMSSGLWKSKSVTGLSISISANGFVFYNEDESGYKLFLAAWKTGKPVTIKCMERGDSTTPYLEGSFIITSLKRSDPGQDDSTWDITLENDGEPTTLDESALTEGALPTQGES